MDEFPNVNPAEAYEQYLGPAIAEPFSRMLLDRAAPRQGQHILDLACGPGIVARRVAPMVGIEGRVVALDISPAMLDVARALPAPAGAAIEWLQGDAIALDLPDKAFDLVLCQQGLQFFSDRKAALREMRRVLAVDGRAVLSVWRGLEHHPFYEGLFRAISRRFALEVSDLDVSFSLGHTEDLQALLIDAGFPHREIEECSLDVRFPIPSRFVQITVLGAATSIPAFARLSLSARSEIIDTISCELAPLIDRYSRADTLEFQMSTHLVVAA